MREYTSNELLPLSGIQHFYFCRRQWALIHVERQWQENIFTVEGKILHKQADDRFFRELRKGTLITRAMPIASHYLGLYGICDVVEFNQGEEGVHLPQRQGLFQPTPIEYKRGNVKQNACDDVQLCAQAICLEEMLSCPIPSGSFYYGEIRHRVKVIFTTELRELVERMAVEMHTYFEKGYTPQVKPTKACNSCSLKNVCLPELQKNLLPASEYIHKVIKSEL